MYTGKDFQPSDPQESETYAFDFVRDLAVGETITAATWTLTVAALSLVNDPTPAARLSGVAQFSGQITSQRIVGLLAGVLYEVQAVVTTSAASPNTVSLWSHIYCRAPA